MRVKICGITNVEDAKFAESSGADAIGLVFYPPSPRSIDINCAKLISQSLGPFVTLTGLFVDPDPAWVQEILREIPLNLLQFHGEESPEFCSEFSLPYIKALRVKPNLDINASIAPFVQGNNQSISAKGILLDTYKKGVAGGTGESFNWQLVPPEQTRNTPIILAGGLTPENVTDAIKTVRPYAVDVSGGVEIEPAIKDSNKVNRFITTARNALLNQ